MGFDEAIKALKSGEKLQEIGSKFLMFVGNSGYQCGWLASQADILDEDWEVVQC